MKRLLPALALLSAPALAIDPGWSPVPGSGWRVEAIVEHYRRDIEQETRNSPFTFIGEQTEDRAWLRLQVPFSDRLSAWVQAGAVDAENSVDPVPGGGVGAEWVLLAADHARLALFGGAVYAHEIEYRNVGGQLGNFVIADDFRQESHIEWGGGLRWSWDIDLPAGWAVQVYTGPVLTAMRGDGEEKYVFPNGVPVNGPRSGGDASVDFAEDGVFGAVAGLGLRRAAGGPALRVESRLIDRTVISAGVSWGF
jgi:hypothetical protein